MMDTDDADACEGEAVPESPPLSPFGAERVISTSDLFGDVREICIVHEGERYRLRITRRGKLILQK